MIGHTRIHEKRKEREKEEQANMQSDNIEMSNMVDHPPHYNTSQYRNYRYNRFCNWRWI